MMIADLPERIIEQSPDGIVAFDRDLRVALWSRGMERMTGLGRDEALGRSAPDLFASLGAAGEDERVRRALEGGESIAAEPQRYEAADAARGGFFEASYSPLHDADGQIVGVGGVLREVPPRRHAEQEEQRRAAARAEERLQAREHFISVAAHELRTPLTALRLQVERLARVLAKADAPVEPAKLGRLVEVTSRQVERLSRLIDETLDVSRITRPKLAARAQEVDLSRIVARAIEHLSPGFAAAGSAIAVELAPGVIGRWDEQRVEQIVTILLTNALSYAPGKAVAISTSTDGQRARLVVRDEGPGIAPADQQRVFLCFERGPSPEQVSGLGLGLYIARLIAETHGGSVTLESEPGKGATFTVELPLALGGETEASG